MRFITVTELKQKATQIISEIESSKEQIIVTKNGRPVVLMESVSNGDFALKERKEGERDGKRNL